MVHATVKPGARIPEWERQLATGDFLPWCFESSGSTMDLGRELSAELTPGRSGLVLAKLQLGGRGRQGRQWVPPASGFFGTYVFSFDRAPELLSGLSLAVGVLVAEAVASLGGEVRIKWPNDLLSVGGEKVAGILVETASIGASTTVLIGIGVNLSGDTEGISDAVTLETISGVVISPIEFALALTPLMLKGWDQFRTEGFLRFRERFLSKAAYLNAAITLDHDGRQENGVFRGVDQRGALRLELEGALVTRASGEVKNLRPVAS